MAKLHHTENGSPWLEITCGELAGYGREHQGTDDGGTSNFDAPTIHLRGWSRKNVEAAAAAAGGSCSFWNLCGSYIFPVPGTGQGNTRTAAAEAAGDYLKELGYDTGMYYQMD